MSAPASDIPLTPLPGRVFVLTDTQRTQTASGIHMVQDWNPDTTGTVVGVGPGERCKCGRFTRSPVAVGDRVLFSYTSGTVVTFGGESYLHLYQKDILATFQDEEEVAHG